MLRWIFGHSLLNENAKLVTSTMGKTNQLLQYFFSLVAYEKKKALED